MVVILESDDTWQDFEVPSGSLMRDCVEPGVRGFSLFIVIFYMGKAYLWQLSGHAKYVCYKSFKGNMCKVMNLLGSDFRFPYIIVFPK